MNDANVFRALIFLLPWGLCVLTDWIFHQIGFHRGPWRWKWSVVTFGIGSLIALWVIQHFDPHFFDVR